MQSHVMYVATRDDIEYSMEAMLVNKKSWKLLLICIAIPQAVGGLSALFSRGSMEVFSALNKPPLSPPGWLFPVVWTLLYTLMGIASYLVVASNSSKQTIRKALLPYGIQLAVHFFWPIFFFNYSRYLFSFVWLVLLLVLIVWTMVRFYPISKAAGELLLPYLLWVIFAGYLNLGTYLLN